MPVEIESAIREAYAEFQDIPVAVRSSATAEDLPDLSFAGQQDTYLNVIGEEEVLKAIINCWSSLWTARAPSAIACEITSHRRKSALAVVVQEMIPSDISGVMFTANPLTGLRSETVIDATIGLGEALVSGQVEPDHYVVDSLRNVIRSKKLGAKEISTRGRVRRTAWKRPGLTGLHKTGTLQILKSLQLAELGKSIQKEYGFPQDIEWAFADGKLYVLQSRADHIAVSRCRRIE